jgi:hypothetical protein
VGVIVGVALGVGVCVAVGVGEGVDVTVGVAVAVGGTSTAGVASLESRFAQAATSSRNATMITLRCLEEACPASIKSTPSVVAAGSVSSPNGSIVRPEQLPVNLAALRFDTEASRCIM